MRTIERDLKLPDSLRDDLQKPFGRVMEASDIAVLLKSEKRRVISVGDSVSEALIKGDVKPSLIIWDGKTRRAPVSDSKLLHAYSKPIRVKNPAATITKEAWDAVSRSLAANKASILVDGEEDLLAIPAIVNGADGDAVVYGLPGSGAILIVIDRKIRALFEGILSRFK